MSAKDESLQRQKPPLGALETKAAKGGRVLAVGASLDLSKVSPSNGQCPTAVSSRNQTIQSREIPRSKISFDQKPGSSQAVMPSNERCI